MKRLRDSTKSSNASPKSKPPVEPTTAFNHTEIDIGPSEHDAALEQLASNVAVLMPSFGTCKYRKENEELVLRWYADRGFRVFLGEDDATTGFFSRARAINRAARTAFRTHPHLNVFVLADNDLIPSPTHFISALEQANDWSCVTPHITTLHTSHTGRMQLLHKNRTYLYRPRESGSRSYVVIRRSVFDHINGMDEKFEGWGPEDKAFLLNIHRQLGGVLELDGARVHLWHPSDQSKADKQQLMRNRERCKLYFDGDQDTANVLSKEYGDWLRRAEQRDRAAQCVRHALAADQ